MTASTMPHTADRHAAVRPTGRPYARRTPGTAVGEGRADLRAAVSPELECEDGCHYCQGPETD